MRILITGGAGFIGSHLTDALVKEGHKVIVLDNLDFQVHQGKKPIYLNKDAEYIFEDVRDKNALKKAIKKVDVIFHFASVVGIGQSMYQIERYVDANSKATALFLETLINTPNSVKKLMVASSMSIYGEGLYKCRRCGIINPSLRRERQLKNKDWQMYCPNCNQKAVSLPTPESKPIRPTSIYALTKYDQEISSLVIGRAYKIPTVALRFFNVYGPRQSLSNPYTGVCAIFSSRLNAKKSPLVYEDGLQSRDFINVKDIVKANIIVMKDKRADYQVFNVGSGKAISVLEIADTLVKLYDSDIQPQIVSKYRVGDIRHCYADISALSRLNFKPSVSLKEGLRELVDWSKNTESKDKTSIANEELEKRGLKV